MILSTPIRNRGVETITVEWRDQNSRFNAAGVDPNTCIMDNEASKDLKDALRNSDIKYQLVPSHDNKTNLSEQVVQIFKGPRHE